MSTMSAVLTNELRSTSNIDLSVWVKSEKSEKMVAITTTSLTIHTI